MNAAKPAGLRVVLDSNVYISAFNFPRGRLSQIWRQALNGRYTLLVSPAIVSEAAEVLRCDFAWDSARVTRRMKLLARTAEIITPEMTLNAIAADPDDDRVLECAVSGHADLIVSGDQHLTRLGSFRGIGIVRPVDFLRTLG
jgi:putative PIN family toxin of toxin-antitoxin system